MSDSHSQVAQHVYPTAAEHAAVAHVLCGNSDSCVAEEAYTATVTDVLPNLNTNSFQVRLIVRFDNVSDTPLILGYRAHSASLLDNFKNRYYCCSAQTAADSSAIGIGIDTRDKVNPELLLRPHDSANVIFELWRSRDKVQAAYYDFDVMIDQIDPENDYRIVHNPILSFRNLLPRTNARRLSKNGPK
jgi:hypothetical protein